MGNQSWTSLRIAGVPVAGVAVAALSVAVTTLIVYPLAEIAPAVSLGVVYLLAVLLVATVWGLWLGVATAVASALAFNFFHIPADRGLHDRRRRALGRAGRLLRHRDRRQRAGRARAPAGAARPTSAGARRTCRPRWRACCCGPTTCTMRLPRSHTGSRRTLDLPSASIEMGAVEATSGGVAFPLREGARQLGTLLVPADLPEAQLRRLQERVVPSLEALLAAALERDELLSNRVEAAALRRTDVLKTALLRAVSHDLRSPLTAILNAAGPLQSDSITAGGAGRAGLRHHAGGAAAVAADRQPARPVAAGGRRRRAAARMVRPARGDPRRGRRAAAARGDLPPAARAGHAADQGRRVAAAARVREPARQLRPALRRAPGAGARAARSTTGSWCGSWIAGPASHPRSRSACSSPSTAPARDRTGHRGSGLGLAIVRGFVEANGGRVWVESLPQPGNHVRARAAARPADRCRGPGGRAGSRRLADLT